MTNPAADRRLSLQDPLKQLPDHHYDVVIIGGGIVGAGIFRDLSLHGLKVLLVDKKDFGSQTSRKTSKMLHGGIRYLETLDLALVYEALHEKNLWIKLAPHLCYPEAFYLPVFDDAKHPLWQVRLGLGLYDFLSSYENTPHRILNHLTTLKELPELRSQGLKGSGVYYDAVVDDARLCLENIYDGLKVNPEAQALNYVELASMHKGVGQSGLELRDCLTGTTRTVTAYQVVFALGPFTDQFLANLKAFPWSPVLLPSKGSHLWMKPSSLPLQHPVVLNTKDNRVIFVIPQGDRVLVGTTEVEAQAPYFDLSPSPQEIQYLLDNLNHFFPKLKLGHADIMASFSGVRPLVKDEHGDQRGQTSREHKVYRPGEDIYVIAGGKYTTFRAMAQTVTRELVLKHGHSYQSNKTCQSLRQRSCFLPFRPLEINPQKIQQSLAQELVRTREDLISRRMGIPSLEAWPSNTMSYEQVLALLPNQLQS